MDPNETLRLAITAFADGGKKMAREHMNDLAAWCQRGGFAPDWQKGVALLREKNVKIAQFAKLNDLARRLLAESR